MPCHAMPAPWVTGGRLRVVRLRASPLERLLRVLHNEIWIRTVGAHQIRQKLPGGARHASGRQGHAHQR
eukprot:8693903-Pyramimonas_sp.AAC.2